MICDECETVAHCMKNGCVPKTIKKDEAFDPQDYIDPETGEPFNPVEQLDLFDFIAGALGVSRGTAYDMIREALAEQPAQQEPEYWLWACGQHIQVSLKKPEFPDAIPLYTRPQAREWVGLSYEDIEIAFDDTQEGGGFDDFARAIEAKLKEKNT